MDLVVTQSMLKPANGSSNNFTNERNVFNRKKLNNSKDSSFNENQAKISEDLTSQLSVEDYKKRLQAIHNLIQAANLKLNLYINNENLKKTAPVTVQIYLIFLRVGEIDNVKERFQADAYFEASWEDDSVDASLAFDPRSNWEPEIYIENAVGNLKQDIKYRVEKDGDKTRIFEMRNIKGIFWEKLELWDFPLDIQNLSITITSSRSINEVKFVPSSYIESTINTNDFQQQQEWNLYPHIETSEKNIYDIWKQQERPCFTISSTISRRPGYFIYNAYMLIFLISALGFVPFSFNHSFPHFRIQTTCLLILSSINFRWIVTQKLPTVSYLTTLDKYAIVALIFLVSLCAWHAVIGSVLFSSIDKEYVGGIDKYALFFIGSLYFFFHLTYIAYFLFRYRRYSHVGKEQPNEELKQDDDVKNSNKSVVELTQDEPKENPRKNK